MMASSTTSTATAAAEAAVTATASSTLPSSGSTNLSSTSDIGAGLSYDDILVSDLSANPSSTKNRRSSAPSDPSYGASSGLSYGIILGDDDNHYNTCNRSHGYKDTKGSRGYDPDDYGSAPVHIPAISISRRTRTMKSGGSAISRRRRAEARRIEAGVLAFLLAAGTSFTLSLCWVFYSGISFPSVDTFTNSISTDAFTDAMSIFGGGGPERALERRAIAAIRDARSKYHLWPVSVREEEANFELLQHPGDAVDLGGRAIELAVPRFYALDSLESAALFDGKLLTRRVADLIGTYTSEEKRNAQDIDARTIFVSIISYRNARCRDTVENIFARAAHPERIRVGVVDQIDSTTDVSCDVAAEPCGANPDQALCKYRNQIDVYEMQSNLAVGPIFSRHISQRLYRGEYYYLQIDSDVTFVQAWDTDIIDQFERAGNDMAVITTYLLDVTDEHYNADTGLAAHQSRYLVCDAGFVGIGQMRRLRHEKSDQPERNSHIENSPQLQPFWAAGFSFSRGHFVLTTPYDPHLAMIERADEEISMAIRAFTNGYDNYAPLHNVVFNGHTSKDSQGEENYDPSAAQVLPQEISFKEHADRYRGKHAASIARLLALIDMGSDGEEWDRTEEDMYGTGRVRFTHKFFTVFGIHVESKITERKLCDFVSSGMMHSTFLDHLRMDGMGIDYNDFYFHFHELLRVHENI